MSNRPPRADTPPASIPTSSVYQEIISAEAYIRHSRAIRRLKSIRHLIIPLLIIAVFCCLVIITFYVAIFIADPNLLHDWDEYLYGKYIDITDSAKDCQVVSIPTDEPNTFDIHVIFIFPHRNFSGISHSIEDSNAEVVAVYENIDGIYNIFRFKHSDIHNAAASNDGDADSECSIASLLRRNLIRWLPSSSASSRISASSTAPNHPLRAVYFLASRFCLLWVMFHFFSKSLIVALPSMSPALPVSSPSIFIKRRTMISLIMTTLPHPLNPLPESNHPLAPSPPLWRAFPIENNMV